MNLSAKKSLCILLIAIFATNYLNAQTDSVELKQAKKPKKSYYLTFRIDNSLNALNFKNKLHYEGEYLESNSAEYTWKTFDSILIKNNEIYRNSNFKFDLLLSLNKSLNIGLSYHIINIQANVEQTDPFNGTSTSIEFFPFFAIAGVVDYKLAIKPVKRLYLNPTVSVGTFQGVDLFTGVGKEWYADLKLALLYNIGKKERFGLRLYADYSNWFYRESKTSRPFPDRKRTVKGDLSSINFGLGLAYSFILIPD